jgi:hypothetical protein
LQWGGVWMMLLFLAFHFVAVSRFSFCCCDRRLLNRVQWISFLSLNKGFMKFTWDQGKTSWC